jgi:hypothetical protein
VPGGDPESETAERATDRQLDAVQHAFDEVEARPTTE